MKLKSKVRITTAAERGETMSANTSVPELSHLHLKILEEFDKRQGLWVATCLETGAVATGKEQETARNLLHETIQLEIQLAIQEDNFANFYRQPAPGEVHARWLKAAATSKTEFMLELDLDLTPPRREVRSEISIERACLNQSA